MLPAYQTGGALHFRAVSDTHWLASQAVEPVLKAALDAEDPKPSPCIVTRLLPVRGTFTRVKALICGASMLNIVVVLLTLAPTVTPSIMLPRSPSDSMHLKAVEELQSLA